MSNAPSEPRRDARQAGTSFPPSDARRSLEAMEATWRRPGSASEWALAVELANAVADGGELPILPSPVLLGSGEVLHGDVTADGWRFHGADVSYV